MTTLPLNAALAALSAAGEETRLRILALIAETELTVTELVAILGQSQPRVSRHLRLLTEAGLALRHREGAWAFFKAAREGACGRLTREILDAIAADDPALSGDRARLAEIRQAREAQAARYFASQAGSWDQLRSLHAPEAQVEAAILDMLGDAPIRRVLDCGTGTGRMLELLASRAENLIGIDFSPAMLSVARAKLAHTGAQTAAREKIRNARLRQGDIYALPIESESCDLVVIHQVLHYLDDPGRALREAARVLTPMGRLLLVDFAPHEEEFLRTAHAHRRLGFSSEDMRTDLARAGLPLVTHRMLAPEQNEAGKLTVSIWLARALEPKLLGAARRKQSRLDLHEHF